MIAELFDNAVTSPPQLLCNEDVILLRVQTSKPFKGLLYVDGQSGREQCRLEFPGNNEPAAQIAIRLGDCGMRRERQLTGVNYRMRLVVSFHPLFRTGIDRSFQIRCFYAMADTTVAAEMDVSTRPPENLEQGSLLNPECAFSVRRDSFDGPPVDLLTVGEKIFYRWDCKPFPTRKLGMLIRGCAIIAAGTTVELIDGRGCPLVPFMNPLVYQSDLLTAYAEVRAYSIRDIDKAYVRCQIKHCELDYNECQGVTPPNCPNLGGRVYLPTSVVDSTAIPTQVVAALPSDVIAVAELGGSMMQPRLPALIPQVPEEPPVFRIPFERRKEPKPLDESDEDRLTTKEMPKSTVKSTNKPVQTTTEQNPTPQFLLLNRSREAQRLEERAFNRRLRDDRFIEVVSPDLTFLPSEASRLTNREIREVEWRDPSKTCIDNALFVPILTATILVTILSFLFILTLLRNLYKRYWKNGEDSCQRVPSRSVTDCTVSSNRSDLSRTSDRSIDIIEEYGSRVNLATRPTLDWSNAPPLRRLGLNTLYQN
ncbi:unnamed protein product, partial [Mesorhabditis belari]|uniref:ZP domain-containing protein n=1 Tax=Mesorhabditis belari TaxID=2138241 RepID=A0AAF3FE25_9BILA